MQIIQAHKTGLFLHKFWNEFPENGCDEEIDSISLHLLQNKIKFTVCKFVELNWSLIHLVSYVITTDFTPFRFR